MNYQNLTKQQKCAGVRFVYIIGAGEFEITIKTIAERKEEDDSSELVGYLRPSNGAKAKT